MSTVAIDRSDVATAMPVVVASNGRRGACDESAHLACCTARSCRRCYDGVAERARDDVQASTGLIETRWVSRLALTRSPAWPPSSLVYDDADAVGRSHRRRYPSAIARALGAGRRRRRRVLHAILVNPGPASPLGALLASAGRSTRRWAPRRPRSRLRSPTRTSSRRQRAGLVAQRARQRHPRHRQQFVPSSRSASASSCWCCSPPSSSAGAPPAAGGGVAVVLTTALTTGVLAWYRTPFGRQAARAAARSLHDILRVGAVGAISTLQTSLTVALTTALVGAHGGPDAVAGTAPAHDSNTC